MKIYITIALHVVLYGSETWSLTLKEEHMGPVQKVFDFIFSQKNQLANLITLVGGAFMCLRDLLRPCPVRLSVLGS
jgi:hypothetical protein